MVNCTICQKVRASFGHEPRTPIWCKHCKTEDSVNVYRMEEEASEEASEEVVEEVEEASEEVVEEEDEVEEEVVEEEVVEEEVVEVLKETIVSLTNRLNVALDSNNSRPLSNSETVLNRLLTKTIQSEMLNLSQKVNKATTILDEKIGSTIDQLNEKLLALKVEEESIDLKKIELEDAEKRCKDYNNNTCFINILYNRNTIWSVNSNQPDSRLSNMLITQLKTCQHPLDKTISAIMRTYKFELNVQQIVPYTECFNSEDQKILAVRHPVTNMVWKRNY
jgi:hypothetical protein